MLRTLAITGISVLAAISAANAQTAKDQEAIKNLCGCFEVSFNYAETFTNDTTEKQTAGKLNEHAVVEMVLPLEATPKKYVMQHLLVAGGQVIKHWREDWEFEKANLWSYNGDQKWIKKAPLSAADVKGEWTQTVWEVDDAPRYQGTSKWVETNGQLFWLNTADAPLPRREYTKRSDYNVMERTNRLIVSSKGYMHEQDNKKIIRKEGAADNVLAYEKGYNKYVRVADSKCDAAAKFWTAEKKEFWKDVVAVWNEQMSKGNTLTLVKAVDDKLMYEALDVVEQKQLKDAARKKEIEKVMMKYITIK